MINFEGALPALSASVFEPTMCCSLSWCTTVRSAARDIARVYPAILK